MKLFCYRRNLKETESWTITVVCNHFCMRRTSVKRCHVLCICRTRSRVGRLPRDFIMLMVVNIASSLSGRLAWHGAATRRCCPNCLKYVRSCYSRSGLCATENPLENYIQELFLTTECKPYDDACIYFEVFMAVKFHSMVLKPNLRAKNWGSILLLNVSNH